LLTTANYFSQTQNKDQKHKTQNLLLNSSTKGEAYYNLPTAQCPFSKKNGLSK